MKKNKKQTNFALDAASYYKICVSECLSRNGITVIYYGTGKEKRKKEKDPDQTVSSLKVKKSGGIAGLPLRAMFLEL